MNSVRSTAIAAITAVACGVSASSALALNPQPLPPGLHGPVLLNPQPLPPRHEPTKAS
jgi:hypothetical protein